MKIEVGQKVVSRSGIVFEIVKITDKWIDVENVETRNRESYTHDWFLRRFKDQLPKNDFKEKPKQGELL